MESEPQSQAPPASGSRADAYYAALLDAWFENRMERDRTVVSLSAAGVGLNATFLTALGPRTGFELAIFGVAALAFFAAIWTGLEIFKQNADHMVAEKKALEGNPARVSVESSLRELDRTLIDAFRGGVLFTIVAAAVAAWPTQGAKEAEMPKEASRVETTQGGDGLIRKSLEGVSEMAPAGGSSPQGAGQGQGQGSGGEQPAGSTTPAGSDGGGNG